jgi:hypothetical protein
MFIGKIVGRRDTLSSAKHAACLMKDSNKSKQVTGLMDKAIAKVHRHELNRYEKLFNTAYAVAKNIRPFSDYTFLCEIQMKNGLHLDSDHCNRVVILNLELVQFWLFLADYITSIFTILSFEEM